MPSVKDIMSKNVISIDQDKSVFEAADLMASKGIGCLVITRQDTPVGMVTERDFVRRVVAKRGSFDIKVFSIMLNI
jgi:predicted transcriptional regulator